MRRCGGAGVDGLARERDIVALDEIDTRALVLRLRAEGAMRAVVVADEDALPVDEALEQVRAQPAMEGAALVAQVSPAEPYVYRDRAGPRRARRLRDEALDPAPARARPAPR